MKTVRRRLGTAIPADATPTIPFAAKHIWDAFRSLHAARGSNGFGPSPISYSDISAWCSLTGFALEPWEVDTIRILDNTYLGAALKND